MSQESELANSIRLKQTENEELLGEVEESSSSPVPDSDDLKIDDFIEADREIEPAFEVSEDEDTMILSPESDDFDEEVAEAHEELLHLQHRREQILKQKAELEELKRKRKKFFNGRSEAIDRLTKATGMLEREEFEAKQRLEQFGHTREAFEKHLELLEAINPEDWERDEIRQELERALLAIRDARDEYTSEMARVNAMLNSSVSEIPVAPLPIEVVADEEEAIDQKSLSDAEYGDADDGQPTPVQTTPQLAKAAEVERDFMYWLRSGFAFTLPLLIFGIFALALLLVIF